MSKSKRSKIVHLSTVKKKDKSQKSKLIGQVQEALLANETIIVYEVENEKSSHMQYIRKCLKPSRMFFGCNKLMIKALKDVMIPEQEESMTILFNNITGRRGLLFTNSDIESIEQLLLKYQPQESAKCGFLATETVVLKEGTNALMQFPHSMENQLRNLGLPTLLKGGTIHLMGDTTVCTKGVPLTVEAAQLLTLLGYQMAKFRMKIVGFFNKTSNQYKQVL